MLFLDRAFSEASVDAFFTRAADWASTICYVAAVLGCVYALAGVWAARRFARTAIAS